MYNHIDDLMFETKCEIIDVDTYNLVLLQNEDHDNNLNTWQIQLENPEIK
jgi:hypothetical protein